MGQLQPFYFCKIKIESVFLYKMGVMARKILCNLKKTWNDLCCDTNNKIWQQRRIEKISLGILTWSSLQIYIHTFYRLKSIVTPIASYFLALLITGPSSPHMHINHRSCFLISKLKSKSLFWKTLIKFLFPNLFAYAKKS